MKKLALLSIILMMSYTSFSQGLTPTLHQLNEDTFFCFSISQSKEIARRIEAHIWCDSILDTHKELLLLFDQSMEVQDSLTDSLKQKISNMELITQNQQINLDLLTGKIQQQKRKLKRGKTHKILLGIGLGIMTVMVIRN